MSESVAFKKATAVWAAGREKEKNLTLVFKAVAAPGEAVLRLTGSTAYQVWINGRFVAAGPARTCPGYFRVDELPVGSWLTEEKNSLAVVVAGYNADSFEYVNQPSFLTAELERDGAIVAATGAAGDFRCREVTERIKKVEKYSYQRNFAEAYRLTEDYERYLTDPEAEAASLPLAEYAPGAYLERHVPYMDYQALVPEAVAGAGKVRLQEKDTGWATALQHPPERILNFPNEELECRIFADIRRMVFEPEETASRAAGAERLEAGRYLLYRFPYNDTGFICATIRCEETTELHFQFDEIIVDGQVDPLRMGCVNDIRLTLAKGTYRFQTFEPYVMQGLRVLVLSGACVLEDVRLQEYAYPAIPALKSYRDPELQLIYDAAVRTFRQNSPDIYMDCPSRERAGWLCDSFFTSRVERILTGESRVERNFLENFLLPESFVDMPEGMLPMCYPSDPSEHQYIPNWAMWFVLELREYLDRTGDRALVDALKKRVYDLAAYFRRYENEDELLENLDGWIFLEWSRANDADVVAGVNYPTNMTYAGTLRAIGELYGDGELVEKADRIIETVRRQSYDADKGFFTDNAVRRDGRLTSTGVTTEVCQYYAFFFGAGTPELYPELWRRLTTDFGPFRKEKNPWPQVDFANMFIGNYLRLDVLLRYGLHDRLLEELKGYFLNGARKTGTLWENNTEVASCDHGFASHVIYILDAIEKAEGRAL